MSLVVIYFGTDRLYRGADGPALAHHDIILGPRYEGLLNDIFNRKVLADDFSLYLHMPTLTDPALAPPGCEAFYVLAPVPHLGGRIDWAQEAKPYRDRIMGFLEDRYPARSLAASGDRAHDRSPPFPGHPQQLPWLGLLDRAGPAPNRPSSGRTTAREELPNLYFVGAGTHPGAGLPGVLSSAKIVDDLIAEARPARASAEAIPGHMRRSIGGVRFRPGEASERGGNARQRAQLAAGGDMGAGVEHVVVHLLDPGQDRGVELAPGQRGQAARRGECG